MLRRFCVSEFGENVSTGNAPKFMVEMVDGGGETDSFKLLGFRRPVYVRLVTGNVRV